MTGVSKKTRGDRLGTMAATFPDQPDSADRHAVQ